MFERFKKKFFERAQELSRNDLVQPKTTSDSPSISSKDVGEIVQTILKRLNENNDKEIVNTRLNEIKDLVKQVKCVSSAKPGLLVPYVPLLFIMAVLITSLVVVLIIRHCKNFRKFKHTEIISNRDDLQRSVDLRDGIQRSVDL